MSKRKKGILYYIYCALGEKSHPHCNRTADRVAFIRLLITLQILITNFFIISNAVRHWNDETKVYVEVKSDNLTPPMIKTSYNKTGEFE